MESMHVQRRRHARQRVDAAVFMRSAVASARSGLRGHCLNISESGAGVVVAGPWQPGQVVHLELVLPQGEQPVLLVARMVHRNRLYCGVEFLGMTDSVKSAVRRALVSGDTDDRPGIEDARKVPLDPLRLL